MAQKPRNIARHPRAASVVIVGVDKNGMGLLRECLRAEAVLPGQSTPYEQAMEQVGRQRPNVVLVGFDANYQEAVQLGQHISVEFPNTTLVAYSQASDPERIRAAMRSGFREFVVLPDDSELLRQAVHDAAYSPEVDEDRGEIIAICGSKGGVGVTSLAINLAAELCPVHRVALVDMDFSMGDVASYLDLRPKKSINEVMQDLDRLDERMLAGSLARHPSQVHVLAQPHQMVDAEMVKGEDVMRLLQVCASSYQYVMVDCGCHIDEATLTTMSMADLIFLVCNPTVQSVKNAWRRLQLFEGLGIEKERLRLIVNKYDRKAQPSLKEIERHLAIRVAATVDADDKTLVQAGNEGKLVRDVKRSSPAARDYSAMVTLITEGDEFIESNEEKKGSPLDWLFS